jgi:integrase
LLTVQNEKAASDPDFIGFSAFLEIPSEHFRTPVNTPFCYPGCYPKDSKMPTLNVPFVEAAKPAPGKRREIPDDLRRGLYLVIQSSGAKSWAARYRFAGKPAKLTLGQFPKLGLADAREAARVALLAVAEGRNPAADKANAAKVIEAAKAEADANSVGVVWAEFCERYINKNMRPNSAAQFKMHAKHFLPVWKDRPIQEIKKRDCIKIIDAAGLRGDCAANTCHMVIKSFFTWATSRDVIGISPMVGLVPPNKRPERERVLTDDELATIWNAAADLGTPFGGLFQMLMLTGQRRGEVAGMLYSEIDFDKRIWTIPGDRSKNYKANAVYLSDLALRIINERPRFDGCDFVFTSAGKTPSANFSAAKADLDKLANIAEWRTHDLRRTFSTGVAALGFAIHVVEKCLNHSSGKISGVAKIYNRHDYADECKAAWTAWASHVAAAVSGEVDSNVIPIRA